MTWGIAFTWFVFVLWLVVIYLLTVAEKGRAWVLAYL